ncbi:MAG: UbiX family flavin prenyltransferase [Archaeoglobales archaeon]|jgi:4-hydroxy-3-polyprenylbenzoate decarboxylase|nr:UbiX family flavin prenyltransferase [Archaeoglobi archaeon]NHW23277.1 UbiX family flavin prenyltransferase [Archaeoglobales archaeon]TDA29608.1 MAG: aromatic acid decarboxylase [Archaeoglobi archaeon]
MKLIVALTGASGQIVGIRLIERLVSKGIEVYVVASRAAKITMRAETEYDEAYLREIATKYYDEDEIYAPFSSGSFRHDGMAIVPCSMKTAASIAYGITDNLITRAADVTLKERRRLVIAPREAPLHKGHLSALLRLSELGAIVYPLVVSFYSKPKNVEEIVDFLVSRIMEQLGFEVEYKRWE